MQEIGMLLHWYDKYLVKVNSNTDRYYLFDSTRAQAQRPANEETYIWLFNMSLSINLLKKAQVSQYIIYCNIDICIFCCTVGVI